MTRTAPSHQTHAQQARAHARAVADWNKHHPVGTRVLVETHDGYPRVASYTNAEAWLRAGTVAVINIDNLGLCLLADVEAAPAAA